MTCNSLHQVCESETSKGEKMSLSVLQRCVSHAVGSQRYLIAHGEQIPLNFAPLADAESRQVAVQIPINACRHRKAQNER